MTVTTPAPRTRLRGKGVAFPPVLRHGLALAGCLALVAPVAGCSGAAPSRPTGGLAIVVGAHSNMPPAHVSGIAAQVVKNAIEAQSDLSVVVADGSPFVLEHRRLRTRGADDVARRRSRSADQQAVEGEVARAAARTPETDLLAALSLAARTIHGDAGAHTILVVDSGLSTTAPMDFRVPGMLDADPADVVPSLQHAGGLPDLGGAHVVFQGLGDTASPQPELGADRQQLVALWIAVARAAGATDVNVEQTPLPGRPDPGLPPVSVVGSSSGVSCSANTVVLTGGSVGFQADSAAFRDPAAASKTLQPIAERMKTGRLTATLTGTTASVGDPAGQRLLSEQRARAVADLLRELGVPDGRLTAVGLGSEFPGYVQDHDAQGNLIPSAAARNRKVTIELSGAAATPACT